MKLVKSFALVFFITLLILTFQNCQQNANSGLLGAKTTQSSQADQVVTGVPFAYDLAVDTISYNSCVGTSLNDYGLHGLKMGVNEGFVDTNGTGAVKAGLKLRSEFLQYIGANLSPNYPSTTITPAQIQYMLQNSASNKDAYIEYAVRKKSDLSVVLDLIQPTATSAIVIPRDGVIEGAALSAEPVLTAITKNIQFGAGGTVLSEGSRAYNLYDNTDPRPIEASFGLSNYTDETYAATTGGSGGVEQLGIGEAYAYRVRQKFNSSGTDKYILAITYANPASGADYGLSTPKRADDTIKTKAYGRSFALGFGNASATAGWTTLNQLKQVSESNLADNTPASGTSWNCENYFIMKQNQWNNGKADEPACVELISSDLANSTIAAKVKRLRRHYLEPSWNIGLYYAKGTAYVPGTRSSQPLCLVPKTTECYLPTNIAADGSDVGVNYDSTTECYLYAASAMGVSYTGNPTIENLRRLGRCAQYASICVRSSTNY